MAFSRHCAKTVLLSFLLPGFLSMQAVDSKKQETDMQRDIQLTEPQDMAEISFLSQEQKAFFNDPYRFNPHTPVIEPRKIDLTSPVPADFVWEGGTEKSVLQISRRKDFKTLIRQIQGRSRKLKDGRMRFRAKIANLEHGRKYFWRVTDGKKFSAVRTFTVADELPRWVSVPEVTNVRDLGGWKTASGKRIRQGMLFRGGQFNPAWTNQPGGSKITPAGRKVLLEDLKIHTELDLRSGKTASALPGIPRYELITFSAYATWGGTPGQGIFSDAMRPQVKKIFELFADPSAYPLYFHCQGGGDRTGTVAFLLENMLGVNDADCLTEYELSNLSVSGERSRYSEVWTKFMEKLETIVPGGSRQEQVCEFLRQCGVADAVQEKIRSILLIDSNQHSEKRIEMKKSRYIDLMEKVLSAYTEEHIDRYYNDVKTGGLKEHGFPRLTADIGILIAQGKRTDLKDRLVRMMDLCCDEMSSHNGCANDFSVKEIIFAIMELEKNRTFPQKQIDSWKEKLKKIRVEKCYDVFAVNEDSKVFNWAAFTMLSEWMRYQLKLAPVDMRFIDNQAASQWQWVDGNGMYRDPHNPMVYDLVPRGLFSLLIHFGYRGKYYERWDCALKKAGLFTLKMTSVTGEIPYGGRSNQFPHNEAHLAIIMEYEAARYARLGDLKTAGQYKAVVRRALDSIESWLASRPIYHVKNRFPRDTKYGCEGYAYFDKYMITTASFLYAAYLVCDDSIPAGELDDLTGDTWQTSEHFHKLFLRADNYFAEYDHKADYHYDASGLGRLHRKGAPSVICLSTPGSDTPAYTINAENPVAFAIVPEVLEQGKWLSGAAREVVHQVRNHSAQGSRAQTEVICRWPEKREVKSAYRLSEDGLQIDLEGPGAIGLTLPAFQFDGTEKCVIENSGKVLTVKYRNWVCRYRTENGTIRDSDKNGYNRNGHYKLFRAEGKDKLTVKIDIFPASNQ